MKRIRVAGALLLSLFIFSSVVTEAGSKRRHHDGGSSFQLRWGGFFPEAKSDFWQDNEALFTLNSSDFDETTVGLTFSKSINNHFEIDLNVDFYDDTVFSDYRDYVDGGGFPIVHESTLDTAPVTVGVRFLPFGRYGRDGSRPVFFVGAGAGVDFWRYREAGDFIDFNDPGQPIVFDVFRDRGATFVGYGTAGIEMPVGQRFNLGLEARYFSAEADLQDDFAGLGTIDLSGFGAYVSGNWRF